MVGVLTGENLKYSEKNLSQCHFVHCQNCVDWPRIQLRLPRWWNGD